MEVTFKLSEIDLNDPRKMRLVNMLVNHRFVSDDDIAPAPVASAPAPAPVASAPTPKPETEPEQIDGEELASADVTPRVGEPVAEVDAPTDPTVVGNAFRQWAEKNGGGKAAKELLAEVGEGLGWIAIKTDRPDLIPAVAKALMARGVTF